MTANAYGTGEVSEGSRQEQFECLAMATSSNSWLHQNLLPQHNAQQQNSNQSLFHHSELPLHVGSQQPGALQHMNLGGHGMDSHQPLHHTMHSSLHTPGDLQQQQNAHLPAQVTGNRFVSSLLFSFALIYPSFWALDLVVFKAESWFTTHLSI